MAAPIRTSIRDILLAVIAEIKAYSDLADDQIIVSVLEPSEVPHFNAAQEVIIQVLDEMPREDVARYSGRIDDRRIRTLRFAVRTRLQIDQEGQDYYRLSDASLGHLKLEDDVYDAICCLQTEDEDDNILNFPARTKNFSQPRRERQDESWVVSYFTADFEYARDLDQSRQ